MIARANRWPPVVSWLPLALIGVLLGAAVPLFAPMLSLPAILLLPGAVIFGLGLIASGPAACIGAIAALATLGGQALTVQIGPVDLQVADVFYAALVLWVIVRGPRGVGSAAAPNASRDGIPTAGIVLFVAYVGLTVANVAVVDPGHLEISMVSWLRLVQTTSLIWLTAAAIRSTPDVRQVIKIVTIGSVTAVVVALAAAMQAGGPSILSGRFGGLLNETSLGLVSGILILLSALGQFSQTRRMRVALGTIGIVGLILSKSVAALIGTVLVLGIGLWSWQRRPDAGVNRILKAMLVTGLGLFVSLALIRASRPEVLPTSPVFGFSTAAHRIVVAVAGWEIFAQDPLTGVGWQRSSSPDVIGASEIAAVLRDRFPGVNPYFFPDITPTSVHNAYVQVLAELGLIGFALFTLGLVRTAVGVRRLVRHVGFDHVLAPDVRFLALSLLFILIWWNDNPIFGGQVETVLASVFLGILISAGRLSTGETAGRPSRTLSGQVAA
jgi:O-antigen ligase